MASANTISLAPVEDGWAVMLTDGRELARFTGPNARRKALGYVVNTNPMRGSETTSIGGQHVRHTRII
jgi:hypothetical protein